MIQISEPTLARLDRDDALWLLGDGDLWGGPSFARPLAQLEETYGPTQLVTITPGDTRQPAAATQAAATTQPDDWADVHAYETELYVRTWHHSPGVTVTTRIENCADEEDNDE